MSKTKEKHSKKFAELKQVGNSSERKGTIACPQRRHRASDWRNAGPVQGRKTTIAAGLGLPADSVLRGRFDTT
jgi:hypothetical protein